MIKLQFLVITIMFLCTMASISSTSKDHVVDKNKNTQNMEKLLNLNPNQSQYKQSLQDQQDKLEKVPNKTSKYTGVCWNRNYKKWQTRLMHKRKPYYGGCFDNEKQAAMQINLLCDKNGIKRKNAMIDLEPDINQQVVGRTSKYVGVCWHRDNKEWRVNLKHNGKQYYGGCFDNEEQAAMQVNLLCDNYGKNRKNPTINLEHDKTKPKINQSKKENVVKTEEECILYGLKDKCENNYIKSNDDSIVTESYTSQKRKRKEKSIIHDDVN